jgi:aspartate/methionine/tyrosine aminotransferase
MTKNEPLVGDDMLVLAEAYKNNPTTRSTDQNNIAELTEKIAIINNWLLIDELYDEPTDIASDIPSLIDERADVAANSQKLGYYFGLRDWLNFDNE